MRMDKTPVSDFLAHLPVTRAVLDDRERVFLAVLRGQVHSRSEATRTLSIRSTTISDHVADLLERRLLTEEISARAGRGRPLRTLHACAERLVTLVFQVISQSVHVFMVNLSAEIIGHEKAEASPESDNEALGAIFLRLYQTVMRALPAGADLAGIVFSLGGVFDRTTHRWIHTSRWPKMHNLDIQHLFSGEKHPISLSRTLDNELRIHMLLQRQSTLLLHWGYGVGFAFGQSSDRIVEGGSAFGEIGHWRVTDQGTSCHCGQTGCLETLTALWSIGTPILGEDFRAGDEEEHIAQVLKDKDITDNDAIQQAVEHMSTAASNVCRVFFPDRLVVSGPFVQNQRIWQSFRERFEQKNRFFSQEIQSLTVSQVSRDLGIYGAALPILEQGLAALLLD